MPALKLRPTPHAMALAVVVATGLTGERPLETIESPARGNMARLIAMAALIDCLPGIPQQIITSPFRTSPESVRLARLWPAWRQDWVDVVCEALATLEPPHGPENGRKLAVLVDEDLAVIRRACERSPGAVSLGEPAPERSALALRAIEAGQPWKMKNIAIAAARGDSGDVAEPSMRLSFERRGA